MCKPAARGGRAFVWLATMAALWNPLAAELPDGERFEFREPERRGYWVEAPKAATASLRTTRTNQLLRAWSLNQPNDEPVRVGNRVVLELSNENDLEPLLNGRALQLSRVLTPHMFILEAAETLAALREAAALANDPRVEACYPIITRPIHLHGSYAPRPSDPYMFRPSLPGSEWQPYLEQRTADGQPLGPDLNVRAAWAFTRGENVMIAIGDDGIDLAHPDLAARAAGAPHFNFMQQTTNGFPSAFDANHGTAVAGLALATSDNGIGIAGVAPQARLASWVLFATDDLGLSDEVLLNVFQYRSNVVSIQNHSWGNNKASPLAVSSVIQLGIANAVTFGRAGRGVVFVRAAGNGRDSLYNANDDGYLTDPRAIAVAAARLDGRVTRYSNPGANVLVAAFSGDQEAIPNPCVTNSPKLLTTDRQGPDGYNVTDAADLRGDYTLDGGQFSGTSAATPQIAGVAALILAANSNLTYRDVNQILIHSAKHYDLADPDLTTNAAGFRVSHNLGFGIPDAGFAVQLARGWTNRPRLTNVTVSNRTTRAIPDLGLRLEVQGTNVPLEISSILTLPGTGLLPDQPTLSVPMVFVGTTASGITNDLRGKAALIERGDNFFCEKLVLAAAAGATFAVVYNNEEDTPRPRMQMIGTEFSPIPSVAISKQDGEALVSYLGNNPSASTRLRLFSTNYTFSLTNSLLCEQVVVQVNSTNAARGDLRITLISPRGTRSVLQTCSRDASIGPSAWKYMTVHNFYENSRGTWTVEISDLDTRGTGSIQAVPSGADSVALTIYGVAITDQDSDGLDDAWELARFGSLNRGAREDPDGDGFNNMREQIMGTNPLINETPFVAKLEPWDSGFARLTWPSVEGTRYEVFAGPDLTSLQVLTNISGRLPETDFTFPLQSGPMKFLRLRAVP